MSRSYYRPIPQNDALRPRDALPLAGGWTWFDRAERITRDGVSELVPLSAIPADLRAQLSAPRPPISGLTWDAPRLMGILNVTPDSFSDGGQFAAPEAALAQAHAMASAGADMIDIGGESTRPGSLTVPVDEEITRTAPVIAAIRAELKTPISIDTRKAPVARAAVEAGANLINDVAGFTYDATLAPYCAETGLPVCVMHAQGDPQTMQQNPRYENSTFPK